MGTIARRTHAKARSGRSGQGKGRRLGYATWATFIELLRLNELAAKGECIPPHESLATLAVRPMTDEEMMAWLREEFPGSKHTRHDQLNIFQKARGEFNRRKGPGDKPAHSRNELFSDADPEYQFTSYRYSEERTVLVGVKELKNRLSEFLHIVRRGGVVHVTDRDDVVAELAPIGMRESSNPTQVPPWLQRLADRGEATLAKHRPATLKLASLRKPLSVDVARLIDDLREDRS